MIASQEQPEQGIVTPALYVGDLSHDVTEQILFKHFGGEAYVTSTKICRDMTTKRSLGYGYVNFRTVEDARLVLEQQNYSVILDRPCRMMWSVRDPTKRKDNCGNLYIKNIDKSVDARTIYHAFNQFGEILSFKIVTDDFGNSKGYGFIHFATQEEAEYVMDKVNGLSFKGREIVVCPFIPKKDRVGSGKGPQYTNLFVKNFVSDFNEEELKKKFSQYGHISSCYFPKDEENNLKGFCFICFEKSENAVKALDALNGLTLKDGTKLYVRRGLKKNERAQELLRIKEEKKRERYAEMKNTNLYVKNLPESATEDMLKEIFGKFGNITSCKIMKDEQGNSKKFGFVCFENQEQASKALSLNNTIIDNKAIYVAIAQSKDERRYQLAFRFSQLKLGNGVSQVRMVQPQVPFGQFPHTAAIPANADSRHFRQIQNDRGMIRPGPNNPMFIQQFGAPQGYMPGNPRHISPYVGHMQQFNPRFRHFPRNANVPNQNFTRPNQPQIQNMQFMSQSQDNQVTRQQQNVRPTTVINQGIQNGAKDASLYDVIYDLPTVGECMNGDHFQLPLEIKRKIGKKIYDYAVHECGADASAVVGDIISRPIVLKIINDPEGIKNSVIASHQLVTKTRQPNQLQTQTE